MDRTDDFADLELEWKLRAFAVPAAIAVALVFHAWPTGHHVQRTFLSMMVHELGHAITAWWCGFGAMPTRVEDADSRDARDGLAALVALLEIGPDRSRWWQDDRRLLAVSRPRCSACSCGGRSGSRGVRRDADHVRRRRRRDGPRHAADGERSSCPQARPEHGCAGACSRSAPRRSSTRSRRGGRRAGSRRDPVRRDRGRRAVRSVEAARGRTAGRRIRSCIATSRSAWSAWSCSRRSTRGRCRSRAARPARPAVS